MKTVNHECYVSLGIAKLLKEAGFDWEGHYPRNFCYVNDSPELFDKSVLKHYTENDDVIYLAPTLEVVQRWMRETKDIYVESVLCVNRGTSGHSFGFSIVEVSADLSIAKILYPSTYFDEEETKGFEKYELSLEAGIEKALELILEKGKKK
jgi:hypothetical protein